jgi:16S rRNA (uracil1498-N3)-methyltransferase
MNLFYTNNIHSGVLDETESRHAIKVLRKKINDTLFITEGKGTLYECVITDDNPKRCCYKIITGKSFGLENYFHLAIAPTKNNDRLEWLVEKATEIGLNTLYPIICKQSERSNIKIERLQKRAISAMKQSLIVHLPTISETINFKTFIKQDFNGFEKYIAICFDKPTKHLKDLYQPKKNAIILIGPEGDFTKDEVSLAMENGFIPVSLGKNRLRTETAGIYACSIINMLNA